MLENQITHKPFSKLGKVYKYEFLNVSKVLVPLYGVLLALGLFHGITYKPTDISFNFEGTINGQSFSQDPEIFNSFLAGLFGLGYIFAVFITIIVTLLIVTRRFKKGMLEEEAYLNMTLPVTVSEHICGRLLSYITWIIFGLIAITISALLSVIKVINFSIISDGFKALHEQLNSSNISIPVFYIEILLIMLVLSSMLILFIFCINSISHLFKTHRTLAKVISTIVLIVITSKIWEFLGKFTNEFSKFANGAAIFIITNVIICGVYYAITQIVFTQELNLE